MNSALPFDQLIVVQSNDLLSRSPLLGFLARNIAVYGVYSIPLVWLVWWFVATKTQRYNLLSSLLAGVIAWHVFNRVIKLLYSHARPMSELPVREFLMERPENSFPSDHAAFLSGIAFFFLLKKASRHGAFLIIIAVLVSASRVAVAVHYPSDILGGFMSGFVAAWLVIVLQPKLFPLWDKAIALAKTLKLG